MADVALDVAATSITCSDARSVPGGGLQAIAPAPIPWRNKFPAPHSALCRFRSRLLAHVRRRVPPVGHRPTLADQPGIDVLPAVPADRNDAAIPIPIALLARDRSTVDAPGKRPCRLLTARPAPAHFDVERAVFMTVLHRLMVSGSDRSALQWRRDQAIDGTAGLELQHLYRAMGWLGEALDDPDPDAPSPRRTKDLIEEELFARRRDLFTALDLVFFDTTSLFFTGNGGDTLGQYGKSKDHRSDCKQMVLGMVIDGDGIPVCSEMWPGNTTDVTTLDQVAARLQSRFGVRRVCLVADAGMISKKMIAAVEARGWFYILGARLRRTKEVRDVVLSDTGAFDTVEVARQRPDPMELQVKEVTVSDTPCKGAVKAPHKPRRYVVCRNRDQARKDAATREQILAALERKLRSDGPKSVVANKGYKRYLKAEKGAFAIDLDKARDEQRFDGMWVLRTNTELSAVEIALRYKQLWMVEQLFRTAKSLLDTRPIFHKTDATICGHVFCSFLALVLRDELFRRMDNAGASAEWDDILRDLNALTETAITYNGKTFVVRSNTVGVAGKIAQCVGVRLPHMVRRVDDEKESADPSL